jgi:4-alpha-glucanotransferase
VCYDPVAPPCGDFNLIAPRKNPPSAFRLYPNADAYPQPAIMPNSSWLRARSSGVLAHVSSLPGEYGIGNFGEPARQFIQFLAEAGFHYWQICPLGPTGYGDSPYQSFSSFAGNPYFIDLSELVERKLLQTSELAVLKLLRRRNVDYGGLYKNFWEILASAHERFLERPEAFADEEPLADFRQRNAFWIESYGRFMGLKKLHAGRSWTEWKAAYRDAQSLDPEALPELVQEEAERHIFYQYLFELQWQRLRRFAAEQSIEIIGDLPIFVALDSADTWQWKEVFLLDEDGSLQVSAGVPPDYFSESGQYWGNPLYNWESLKESGYDWWIQRLQRAFDLYDVIRLDHFRAFDTYWEIPRGSEDARTGTWRKGPGMEFLSVVNSKIPKARIIAEDLGYITRGVFDLRTKAGYPGMKIMQFAYGHDDNNVNLPHFHTPDSVVYTGTHDNTTIRGWLEALEEPEASLVRDYFKLGKKPNAWPLIEAAFASPARLAVIPLQDLLNLDATARMNIPGTSEGNWMWRYTPAQLNQLRKRRMATFYELHTIYDRTNDDRQRDFSAPPDEA